jgi:hypothetical protein
MYRYMKMSEEMIDAIGGVIPPESVSSRVSLRESDCYALVDCSQTKTAYVRNPSQVVFESIMWGSRVLKGHPLYWADKRKLMTRILRSANTALFALCKEQISLNAVQAMVGFRGNVQLWLAVVGNVDIWNYKDSCIERVYPKENDGIVDPLGKHRYGFVPHIVSILFATNGYTIISVGSISHYLQNIGSISFASIDDVLSSLIKIKEDPGAWIIIPHMTEKV